MIINAELKHTIFMITYSIMRKKSAGKKIQHHLDVMLGISTELNYGFLESIPTGHPTAISSSGN